MHLFLYEDVKQDVKLIGQNKKKCKAEKASSCKEDDRFFGFQIINIGSYFKETNLLIKVCYHPRQNIDLR
jgi:hypothetical protein